jgi:hypothetical protein
MPAKVKRTPQRTVSVDEELWSDCLWIARKLRVKLSDVLRAALVAFRDQHRDLLHDKPATRPGGRTDP